MTERFEFAFASQYAPPARFFGIHPGNAWVQVTDADLDARFGRWRVRTPRSNVVGGEVTGPYAFWKTAGPARLAITDIGLTFATNGAQGVRLDFAEPVRGMDRFGILKHPELTVTVREPARLLALLTS